MRLTNGGFFPLSEMRPAHGGRLTAAQQSTFPAKPSGGPMNTLLRSRIFLAPFHPKAGYPTLAMERDFK
jgi:hypothetical protein